MSVCVPVCMEELGFRLTKFHEVLYLSIFWKSIEKINVILKYDKNNDYFARRSLYLAEFFLEWEMFQTKIVQKIKTLIL